MGNLPNSQESSTIRQFLSKVPEVTIYFWVIKVLCTTVGETASDFLNVNLGLGLTGTSIAMGVLLLVVMFYQIKAKRYIPGLYWFAVFLISSLDLIHQSCVGLDSLAYGTPDRCVISAL